ncbi:MAG: cadmium resistance transporter [Microcystaceae cyanobacterium]
MSQLFAKSMETMAWLLQTIISAISAFVATNLDDILILMFLFSQVNANFRIRHIFIGQYLGFIALLLLSLPGFFGGLIIPKTWTGLLGLVPIFIGLKQLFDAEDDDHNVQAIASDAKLQSHSSKSFFGSFLAPQTYSVAAITFANGGDNIGIYVPFFASLSWSGLLVVLSVFLILVAVWCAIAYSLSRNPIVGEIITKYGEKLVPWVLIGLGIWILWESHSYELLNFSFR